MIEKSWYVEYVGLYPFLFIVLSYLFYESQNLGINIDFPILFMNGAVARRCDYGLIYGSH